MANGFLSQFTQPQQRTQPEIDLAPAQQRVQPQTQKPIDYAGFRQFVFKKVPNITADQVKQLDDVIANRQRQELVRQGVIDVAELAKTDPGGASRLVAAGQALPTSINPEQQKTIDKLKGVAVNVDLLEKNLKQVELRGPVWGRLKPISDISRGSMFPEVQDYEALRKAMIGPLARAISGEVGVLTDRDIARAEELLPRIDDDPVVVKNKLANLRQTVSDRLMTLGGTSAQSTQTGQPIRVRDKASGQTGTIEPEEFDPNLYERMQ